mmetsp:Transcript_2687/g.3885  ORF Transcript_2687/g.3885 Transcript_2687/m.3885 type:complete len:589 (-) Transcript_2687:239-2005(-)
MSVVTNAREMRYDCPYCKKEKGCCSLFFWAVRLTAEDYQSLVENGWCRCGRMIYFPINEKCCCPQHSMRIDAVKFRENSLQKKINSKIKRLQRGEWRPKIDFSSKTLMPFTSNDSKSKDSSFSLATPSAQSKVIGILGQDKGSQCIAQSNSDEVGIIPVQEAKKVLETKTNALSKEELEFKSAETTLNKLLKKVLSELKFDQIEMPTTFAPSRRRTKKRKNASSNFSNMFSTNAAFIVTSWLKRAKKAGLNDMKRDAKAEKRETQIDDLELKHVAMQITTGLEKGARSYPEIKSTVQFKVAGRGYINAYLPWLKGPVNGPVNKVTQNEKKKAKNVSLNPKMKLCISVKNAHFAEDVFKLYAMYQIKIHKDPIERITKQEFKAFLVDTPIVSSPSPRTWENIWPHNLGSSFRIYHLESSVRPLASPRLVGYALLDVLPSCLYSSYFVWHPEAKKLSLGVVSALEEIAIVKKLAEVEQNPNHLYYIGYYVHKNKQMQYKRQYTPSELYCPHAKKWVPFDEKSIKILEDNPHGPLVDLKQNEIVQKVDSKLDPLNHVMLLYRQSVIPYKNVKEQIDKVKPALRKELEVFAL